jgi:hypothetical protein
MEEDRLPEAVSAVNRGLEDYKVAKSMCAEEEEEFRWRGVVNFTFDCFTFVERT